MCEVMQKYENLAVKEERISKIIIMKKAGYSKEDILALQYTEDEYKEAEDQLLILA